MYLHVLHTYRVKELLIAVLLPHPLLLREETQKLIMQ